MFGKLFISTNQFCFKSSGPLTRTRVSGIYLLVDKLKATIFDR